MYKWSVALYGHYKEKKIGWEKRAIPGDIIDFKPHEKGDIWTPKEKKEFLTVTLEGFTADQMYALREEYWDLNSYREYSPLDKSSWIKMMQERALKKANSTRALEVVGVKGDLLYQNYLDGLQKKCMYPTEVYRKRRFNIDLITLRNLGVDIDKMLDCEILYVPDSRIVLNREDCFDKKNNRNANESDNFNLIQPRTLEEMIGA
jgi:hypothetical protein